MQRIGISATQKPIERIAEFLTALSGDASPTLAHSMCSTELLESSEAHRVPDYRGLTSPARLVDHRRRTSARSRSGDRSTADGSVGRLLARAMGRGQCPAGRIDPVASQHADLRQHAPARRARDASAHGLLGEEQVGSHHGSLAADIRLTTEQRLKTWQLKAVVATASLELGIDVGTSTLWCSSAPPGPLRPFCNGSAARGHALGLVPKGRLFALTRDELLECMALIRAVKAGRLDVMEIPVAPLDMLAQQIVAEVSAEEWRTDDLLPCADERIRTATCRARRSIGRSIYLSEGVTDTAGRSRRSCITTGQWPGASPQVGPAGSAQQRRGDRRDRQRFASSWSRSTRSSVRWTRSSASRAWRGTSSCWAIRRGGSRHCAATTCSSPMPTVPRRRFLSGAAKPPVARSNCRRRCPACGRRFGSRSQGRLAPLRQAMVELTRSVHESILPEPGSPASDCGIRDGCMPTGIWNSF